MAALIISVVAAWDEPSESEQNENRELSVMMDDLNVFAGWLPKRWVGQTILALAWFGVDLPIHVPIKV